MRAWNAFRGFWGQEDRALSSPAAHRLEHRYGSAIGRAILWQYARLFARVGTPENNTLLLNFLNRHRNSMVVDFIWLADRGLIRGIPTGEMNLASHLRLINRDRSVGGAAKGGSTDGE
jgi:hypothetical protein